MIYLACEQGKRIVAIPVSEEDEALGINTQEQLADAARILNERQK
jgi:bifunctional N-acetylglucosamine-1-phosphate-uridyltransferase/glucosamine-1-phosphate-acetyltransferase GlmU-like protein